MSGVCTCVRGSTTTASAIRELYDGRETRPHQDGALAGGKVFRLGCVHYSDADPSFFIFSRSSSSSFSKTVNTQLARITRGPPPIFSALRNGPALRAMPT